jgi:hypothetical protein
VRRAVRSFPTGVTVVVLLALGVAGPRPDASAAELRTVGTRPGVTETFLLVTPTGPPVASVILFAGGHGGLALSAQKIGWGEDNFLVRSRDRFAAHGLLVAVSRHRGRGRHGHRGLDRGGALSVADPSSSRAIVPAPRRNTGARESHLDLGRPA